MDNTKSTRITKILVMLIYIITGNKFKNQFLILKYVNFYSILLQDALILNVDVEAYIIIGNPMNFLAMPLKNMDPSEPFTSVMAEHLIPESPSTGLFIFFLLDIFAKEFYFLFFVGRANRH